MPAQIGGEPPNFTAGCRQRAGEEMEVEEQEAAIFDVEDDVFEAPSSSGWRKGLIGNVSNVASKLGLGGLMGTVKGGASSTPEAPKQLASPHSPPGHRLSGGTHPELNMLLDNFDAAHARLWQISTGVNTELMLNQISTGVNTELINQAAWSGVDSERQALADSLLAVSESYAHDLRVPFAKAGEALHAVVRAERGATEALATFQAHLEGVLAGEVALVRDAVVSLEKARARTDAARLLAREAGGGGRKEGDDRWQARRDAEEAQVAVLLDLLPPALLRIEAAALASVEFSLPTLDRLAAKAAAASAARRLLPGGAADARNRTPLERLFLSPAESFAVWTGVARNRTPLERLLVSPAESFAVHGDSVEIVSDGGFLDTVHAYEDGVSADACSGR
ncbi:hypothetical protein T484DRAFT_1888567 [Baffinella frigidus]|nr:hypothetical protein T484DRAFT_1888567 [Cryptophyta sp. CCMP2293]